MPNSSEKTSNTYIFILNTFHKQKKKHFKSKWPSTFQVMLQLSTHQPSSHQPSSQLLLQLSASLQPSVLPHAAQFHSSTLKLIFLMNWILKWVSAHLHLNLIFDIKREQLIFKTLVFFYYLNIFLIFIFYSHGKWKL